MLKYVILVYAMDVSPCGEVAFTVRDRTMVRGGGYWEIDREKKHLYLYGSSHEFGATTRANIIRAIQEGWLSMSLDPYEVHFLETEKLEDNIKAVGPATLVRGPETT